MKFERFVVIGCGGIGGALAPHLARFMQFSLKGGEDATLVLVDGDSYEPKNLDRQNCGWGDMHLNKAKAMMDKLSVDFDTITIDTFEKYVNAENISDVIKEGDCVFIGVDNHKSRKIISDHLDSMKDVTVISGGNEMTDGNVMIVIKKDGEYLTASLTELNPEIANPKDKSPEEVGCAALVKSAPQIIFMNLTIAVIMLNAFYRLNNTEELEDMYGEVCTDITLNRTVTYERPHVKA